MERTLLIVKPDGVERKHVGEVLRRVEEAGFTIRELKMVTLTRDRAGEFYKVHQSKQFYEGLVSYMSSGRVVAVLLEKDAAVSALRDLAGSTDPKKANPGTIRSDLGLDVQRNTVHAADSVENAKREIDFFFGESQLIGAGNS